MTEPWEFLSSSQIKALLAVIQLWETTNHVTVRGVGQLIGRNVSTTHGLLARLKAGGWIDWEEGRHGTIHPTLRTVELSHDRNSS